MNNFMNVASGATSMLGSGGTINWAALWKQNDVSKEVQTHLQKTFRTLAMVVASGALGTYLYIHTHMAPMLFFLGTMLCLWGFHGERDATKRTYYLLGFGICKGGAIGSLVETALFMDPAIVTTAFLVTLVVFGCFAGAAMFAKRRSYMYLGATLGSVMGWMCIASLANMFMRSSMVNDVLVYGGLIAFCAYVLFDTQLIIERAAGGDRDHQRAALTLFIDFAAIFVRVLIILMKMQKRGERKKKKNSGRR